MVMTSKSKIIYPKTLSDALKERGLRQIELAKAVGKSQRLVSAWCLGDRKPNVEEVIKIALFFNVPTEIVLNWFSAVKYPIWKKKQ